MTSSGLRGYLLPRPVFEQICEGPVSVENLAFLRKGQYSLRRLTLLSLFEAVRLDGSPLGPFGDLEHAWTVLTDAERVAPEVVEEVLMYPTVGVWSARVLRKAIGAWSDVTPLWAEAGMVHSIAAAAAIRCGLRCTITIPVMHGVAVLPTVGQFRLPPTGFPVGYVELRTTPSGVVFSVPGDFEPVKVHRSTALGTSLDVVIDDADPYREFLAPGPPTPLSDNEFDEWRKLLDEAWRLLTRWHPGYAAELAAGLTSLVPLSGAQNVFASSSSSAFGSMAMSPKSSATDFAEALVHEFQHSKLNALCDLVDLDSAANDQLFYAPWRDDPRPMAGLIHGIYAFTSVVEFWHVQRDLVPSPQSRAAQFAFAYRSRQVRLVVDALRRREELTDLGRRLVARVSVRLAACPVRDVPADLLDAIDVLIADHHATWRVRHLRLDVSALVDAWLTDAPRPAVPSTEVLPRNESGASVRSALLRTRVLEPDRFERMSLPDDADTAFVRGDLDMAAMGYLRHIRSDPADGHAWVGLGLSLGSTAPPEVWRALHNEVLSRTGSAPDPVELAAWLSAAS